MKEQVTFEDLKAKWGGNFPQIGDLVLKEGVVGVLMEVDAIKSLVLRTMEPVPLNWKNLMRVEEFRYRDGSEYSFMKMDGFDKGNSDLFFRKGDGFLEIVQDELHPFPKVRFMHQLQALFRMFCEGKELTYKWTETPIDSE